MNLVSVTAVREGLLLPSFIPKAQHGTWYLVSCGSAAGGSEWQDALLSRLWRRCPEWQSLKDSVL